MANGDNPLPGLPQWAQTLSPAPDATTAPEPSSTPPDQASAVANAPATSLAPTPLTPMQDAGAQALPAPYQGSPANRGGPVKNILTRLFYGAGQAGLAHVGLPTDYDIQRTTFNQAIAANEQQLKQAQLAMQYQMVTLPNGVTLPLAAAQRVYPALIGAQSREDVARLNKELIPTAQGLYRTGYASGQPPGVIPGTERGTTVDDALIAEYPQLGPLKGSFLKPSELMRAYSQQLQTAPTTSTTYDPVLGVTTVTHRYKNVPSAPPATGAPVSTTPAPTPGGGLPEIPQPVQSPLLPSGPLTQAESDRLKQFGINAPAGIQPTAAPPPAPSSAVPPAVRNVVPPNSPAGRAFGTPAAAQAPTGGPGAVAIPPAPAGIPGPIWATAVRIVEGDLNPNQMQRGKYGFALQNAVDAYSRQKYGTTFDQAKAGIDYNYASQTTTQNTLKYLNSLTGPDNKSGNLQQLVNLSKSPDLNLTQFPPLNDVQAWAKIRTGNPTQAAYAATILEVADQVGKILQGGSQGTSDKKLNDAQALFNKGFTPEQMSSVATSLRGLLANRKTELIGDNRYLQRQFGPGGTAPQGGGTGIGAGTVQAAPQSGEQPVYRNGNLIGYSNDGKTITRLP